MKVHVTALAIALTMAASTSNAAHVVHYEFNGNFNDSSGLGNHALSVGSPRFVPSDSSGAVYFDNPFAFGTATQWLQLPNSTSIVDLGSKSFSYSIRLRSTDDAQSNGRLFGNLNPVLGNRGLVFNYSDADTAQAYHAIVGNYLLTSEFDARPHPEAIVTDGGWHWIRVAVDRQAGEVTYDVDGRRISTIQIAPNFGDVSLADLSIGRTTYQPSFSARFTAVDEFILEEISTAPIPEPATTSLVGLGIICIALRHFRRMTTGSRGYAAKANGTGLNKKGPSSHIFSRAVNGKRHESNGMLFCKA